MKRHLQPKGLFESRRFAFTQVVTSPPGTLVFISGQTPWDERRRVVGGQDFAAQAAQAFGNLGLALAGAGAAPADVTMLRIYVKGLSVEHSRVLWPVIEGFFEGCEVPAQTMVGVETLANPAFLIEVEALAVV
jgi:enamine deaminase RidA (YjgF/YER057c/UK114 family)